MSKLQEIKDYLNRQCGYYNIVSGLNYYIAGIIVYKETTIHYHFNIVNNSTKLSVAEKEKIKSARNYNLLYGIISDLDDIKKLLDEWVQDVKK